MSRTSRTNHEQEDSQRKPRFTINVRAKIRIQLFGSSSPMEFKTCNISENGLLLGYNDKDRLNFNQFSILETWLYTGENKPISFLTKFVRYQDPAQIAIRIIDIDNESHKRYQEFISELASHEVN